MNSPIHTISSDDAGFPTRLLSIPHPPSRLYYQGDISLGNNPKIIAIVGTRTPTPEGIEECKYITKWFVDKGYVIISGLALGIDTVTHEACIRYAGRTIAVLPSGLRKIYPKENRELAGRIVKAGGLIITEYQEMVSPRKFSFIQRDRLQSGLSMGEIVVESEINGGAMHTAQFALKQKRPLACVGFSENSDNRSGNRELLKREKTFRILRETLVDFERLLWSKV